MLYTTNMDSIHTQDTVHLVTLLVENYVNNCSFVQILVSLTLPHFHTDQQNLLLTSYERHVYMGKSQARLSA